MVAASSMALIQSLAWTLALVASSLDLKERMKLPLGSRKVLRSAFGMSIPLLPGSWKWTERSVLSLVVSSVAGSLQMGASLLAFRMEMKIPFSCTSGEVAGLGGVEQEREGGPRVAKAYDRGGERG